MTTQRRGQFVRNEHLEVLLKELNGLLEHPEAEVLKAFKSPCHPPVLVIGAPRSGTTVTMQWLAGTGSFGYPSNLLARFYRAPYIGARIQQMLLDPKYDFNGEFSELTGSISYASNCGKTRGILTPSEFFYFWYRFLPNELRPFTPSEMAQVDSATINKELAALEAAFEKPFATKGMFLQFNLPEFSPMFEKVLFLYIKREPFYTIQSILEAREKFYGDRNAWWSCKPAEFGTLQTLDAVGQVTGQVYFTQKAIEDGLARIEPDRQLTVQYETFCENPGDIYRAIADKLAAQGTEIPGDYKGAIGFESTNQNRLSAEDSASVLSHWERFSGSRISP